MKHRLYLAEPLNQDTTILLDRDRTHYLLRVLRLRSGQDILVFNGDGTQWQAEVEATDSRACTLHIVTKHSEKPLPSPLVLAQAWLKGSAMDTVVEKATELGATDIQLLYTQRVNVALNHTRIESKLNHFRKIAQSAAEQSGRLYVPGVHPPVQLAQALAGGHPTDRFFLDLDQPAIDPGKTPRPLELFVGPEGGWTEDERQLAVTLGATLCGLGEITLRAETAPLAALAAIRHSWAWR